MSQSVGDRIREVRGSMGIGEFAETLGVNRKTVTRWENAETVPDGASLLALKQRFDADPSWVLTGRGPGLELSDDERELLAMFRAAPLAVKAAALGALTAGSAPEKSEKSVSIKASGGRFAVAGGTYHEHGKPKKK